MPTFPITNEMRGRIAEELKDDYFAKTSLYAYEKAIEIINEVNTRQDLKPFINHYMKEDLHIRNLLAKAHQILLHTEPIDLEVGEIVNVPSNVYKTKVEPAKILEINHKDYSVLVRPLRDRAEVLWVPTDSCKRKEIAEQVMEEKRVANL